MDISAIKLKTKIPLAIVGVSIAVALVLQGISYVEMRSETIDAQEMRFIAQTENMTDNLQDWVNTAKVAALELSATPAVRRLFAPGAESQGALPAGAPDDAVGALEFQAFMDDFVNYARLDNVYILDIKGRFLHSTDDKVPAGSLLSDRFLNDTTLSKVLDRAANLSKGETAFVSFAGDPPLNGHRSSFVAAPILTIDGKRLGVVAVELGHDDLYQVLTNGISFGTTTEPFLVAPGFEAASTSRTPGIFELGDTLDPSPQVQYALEGSEPKLFHNVPRVGDPADSTAAYALSAPLDLFGEKWGVVIQKDKVEVLRDVDSLLYRQILISLAAVAAVLGLGLLIGRSITRPLDRVTGAIHRIGDGNLDVEVTDTDRRDELGDIAKAVERQRALMVEAEALEAERARQQEELRLVVDRMRGGMQRLADGDLSSPITQNFSAEYEVLRENYNQTLAKLNGTISQVVGVAESIRARSTEINHASVDLSRRTENQAAALEETAAALDALTVSVKANADGASEVESTVRTTRAEAEESGKVVKAAVAKMNEIQHSSEQISNISGTIEDIAFQTNLLALNAGVEAARAGDAGKGFAVVASEVRALAQRSSDAAKEIKTLITSSGQHVRTGVDQVNRAGTVIENIVGRVAHISELMSNIATGAAEQSSGLAEINIGVTQLDRVTQQNAAMVEESSAASQGLQQDATTLAGLVSHFRIQAGQSPVRAAVPAPAALGAVDGVANTATAPVARQRTAAEAAQGVWQDF
jgi:methyl-accepting chemotaxis protein